MPLKKAGIRIDPPMSEPNPITEPVPEIIEPSPPLLPPAILKRYLVIKKYVNKRLIFKNENLNFISNISNWNYLK